MSNRNRLFHWTKNNVKGDEKSKEPSRDMGHQRTKQAHGSPEGIFVSRKGKAKRNTTGRAKTIWQAGRRCSFRLPPAPAPRCPPIVLVALLQVITHLLIILPSTSRAIEAFASGRMRRCWRLFRTPDNEKGRAASFGRRRACLDVWMFVRLTARIVCTPHTNKQTNKPSGSQAPIQRAGHI